MHNYFVTQNNLTFMRSRTTQSCISIQIKNYIPPIRQRAILPISQRAILPIRQRAILQLLPPLTNSPL